MAVVKNKSEQLSIKKACIITDQIFSGILRDLKKDCDITEYDLAKIIRKKISERGLRVAFPPIVTSGPRAGNEIHPKPTKNKISGFVIIDFGVRVDGYCSDMTRTIYIGNPTKKEREIYEMILRGQMIGVASVADGASCALVDKTVRIYFGKYKKYFIHTLGHGVGKRIHEKPTIYENRKSEIFKSGMVVTIEPGIYIKNKLGIRIEDTLLVKTRGSEVFTKSPKKLLVFFPG